MQVSAFLRQNLLALRVATTPVHDRTADKPIRKITLPSVNTNGGARDERVKAVVPSCGKVELDHLVRAQLCQIGSGAVKRLNARRIKIHRTYTVDEAARLFRVHKNTVRAWVKSGLPTTDARRSILILGRELARFLHERRQRTRQQCQPGQFYCLRCRSPREPASRVAAYVPITSSSGNLRGQCGDCGVLMWRRVSLTRLSVVAGALDVTFQGAQQRIEDNSCFSLNSDLAQEASTHANAQPGK